MSMSYSAIGLNVLRAATAYGLNDGKFHTWKKIAAPILFPTLFPLSVAIMR